MIRNYWIGIDVIWILLVFIFVVGMGWIVGVRGEIKFFGSLGF